MQTMDSRIQPMNLAGFFDRAEAILRSSNPGKMERLLPPKAGQVPNAAIAAATAE